MSFQNYLNNAWDIHPTESEKLLSEFKNHFSMLQSSDEVVSLAQLVTHVSGEHLGKWNEGLVILEELKENPMLQDHSALNRFIGILSLGRNSSFDLQDFNFSDQARILAMTASALASQNEIGRAGNYLKKACELAQFKLSKEDSANRSIAITGNNLASTLEEKESRGQEENELMIEAALVGRKFWEIAGGWKEVERAEYRLAQSYIKAGKLDKAFEHAENCLKIIHENGNESLEVFFGYEVLALVEKTRANQLGFNNAVSKMTDAFALLSSDDQAWCKKTLETFFHLTVE